MDEFVIDPKVSENALATRDAKEMMEFIGDKSPKFWQRFYKLVQKKVKTKKSPARKKARSKK